MRELRSTFIITMGSEHTREVLWVHITVYRSVLIEWLGLLWGTVWFFKMDATWVQISRNRRSFGTWKRWSRWNFI